MYSTIYIAFVRNMSIQLRLHAKALFSIYEFPYPQQQQPDAYKAAIFGAVQKHDFDLVWSSKLGALDYWKQILD
jgi:hypothetical protein